MTLAEFWPFYLGEHRHPHTRAWHLAGTLAYLTLGLGLLLARRPGDLWILPIVAYGCAWYSHLAIEKNRPATFKHPLWSFVGDWKMLFLMLTGKLKD